MLDPKLAAAFIDNTRSGKWSGSRILGRRLRRFSLWHRFLLVEVQSPFLTMPKRGAELPEISFFDIRNAVAICRLRPFQSKVRRPWLVPLMSILWIGWSKKRWQKYLERLRDRLLFYFGDYISRPEWTIIPPRFRGPMPAPHPHGTIPEDIRIAGDIIGWSHWPEEVVWGLPMGRAYWYQMMAQRAAGCDVDFMDVEERIFQEKTREEIGAASRSEKPDGVQAGNGEHQAEDNQRN